MYFLGNKYNLLQLQTNKCFSVYILSFLATRTCHSNYYNVLRDNLRERRIFRVTLQSSLPAAAPAPDHRVAPSPTIGLEELPAFPIGIRDPPFS